MCAEASLPVNPDVDAEAIVKQMAADWARLGLGGDRAGLIDLYTQDAIFFGSLPEMYIGQRGVAEYFELAPLSSLKTVSFDWREFRVITPSVISAGGLAYFGLELEGEPVRWRFGISWVLVGSNAKWQIASHHASRRELSTQE